MTLKSLIPRLHEDIASSCARSVAPWDAHNEVARLFEEFFEGSGQMLPWLKTSPSAAFEPCLEYRETEKTVEIKFELPGMSEKDVSLQLQEGELRLSGEKRCESEHDGHGVKSTELSYGQFERVLSLPPGLDVDKVKARFANGVLNVSVPKLEPKKPIRHQVEITAV